MIAIVSKISFFTSASRAVTITTTRNIYTKEYLGLSHLQGKQNESRVKAGKNAVKIKDSFLKSYNQRGIKDLRRIDILKFMDLVDGEKDMNNLTRVVEDFLAHTGPLWSIFKATIFKNMFEKIIYRHLLVNDLPLIYLG